MKFKDSSNNVHEIDLKYTDLLPSDAVAISEEEAAVLSTPIPKTQAEIDAEIDAEAEEILNIRPRERVILKQIFLLRKISEPTLTQSQFLDELKADYKAFKG